MAARSPSHRAYAVRSRHRRGQARRSTASGRCAGTGVGARSEAGSCDHGDATDRTRTRRSETTGPAEHDHHPTSCGDDLVGEPCDGHAGLAAGRRPRRDRHVGGRRAARPHRLGRGAGELGRLVLGGVGRAARSGSSATASRSAPARCRSRVTPLLLLLVFVYIAVRWARRLAATERLRVGASAWSRVAQWGVVPGFVVGYGLVSGGLRALHARRPGDARASRPCSGRCSCRSRRSASSCSVPTTRRRRRSCARGSGAGPTWLPSVWRVGWRGAGLLLALGLVVVVAARRRVVVDGRRRPGPVRRQRRAPLAVIALAQLALLGNAATWALSFLAGPGFQVALGSHDHARRRPARAAAARAGARRPAAGRRLPGDHVCRRAGLPCSVGVWLGRRVDAELEFFGNVRARLTATAVAALIAVAVVVVADGARQRRRRGRPALGRRGAPRGRSPPPSRSRSSAARCSTRPRSCCASAGATGSRSRPRSPPPKHGAHRGDRRGDRRGLTGAVGLRAPRARLRSSAHDEAEQPGVPQRLRSRPRRCSSGHRRGTPRRR